MFESMPPAVSTASLVAVAVFALGLVLWMYGWGQREPTRTAQLGTALMSIAGLCVAMIAIALSIGLFVSSLAQAVQANAVGPRQQQTPVH